MAKSKFLKTAGIVFSGILILGIADFLTARNFAPNPLYKKRGAAPQQAEPEQPPLDLSKLKVSDTNTVLSKREALGKKTKLELKALTENDTMAMMEIGMMYQGVSLGEPDIAQSIYWYEKAADAGDDNAAKLLPGLRLAQKFSGVIGTEQSGTQSLGEALAPATKEMSKDTTGTNEDETSGEKPSKVIDYLTGKNKDKEMLADTFMTDGEKRLLMSLMSVSRLKKIAKTGNIMAQNQLGLKYYDDDGKDAKNALHWFMEAAKGGHDTAVTNAVTILDSEQISQPNRDKTIAWMRAQADQGRTPAQLVVGKFYRDGRYDFPEDKAIGFAWIEKAAKGSSSEAQFELGFAKMLGSDVPEDKAGGIKWLRASAAEGNMRGEFWLADAYRDGDFVLQDDGDALEYFERAHNSGHSRAALQMVFIYRDQDSIEQDDDKLRKWVEIMIAKDGNSVGYEFAGDMYLEGRGYLQDDKTAFENYEIAANKDNGAAQYKLAVMMLEGRGTVQNKQMAIEWLQKADKNYSYAAGVKLKELGINTE